jgi:hypothetical protein
MYRKFLFAFKKYLCRDTILLKVSQRKQFRKYNCDPYSIFSGFMIVWCAAQVV